MGGDPNGGDDQDGIQGDGDDGGNEVEDGEEAGHVSSLQPLVRC